LTMPASKGKEMLVPATLNQPPLEASYIATLVATAEKSGTPRWLPTIPLMNDVLISWPRLKHA
jgi:hypothetical protein